MDINKFTKIALVVFLIGCKQSEIGYYSNTYTEVVVNYQENELLIVSHKNDVQINFCSRGKIEKVGSKYIFSSHKSLNTLEAVIEKKSMKLDSLKKIWFEVSQPSYMEHVDLFAISNKDTTPINKFISNNKPLLFNKNEIKICAIFKNPNNISNRNYISGELKTHAEENTIRITLKGYMFSFLPLEDSIRITRRKIIFERSGFVLRKQRKPFRIERGLDW